jgi:nucleoside-diphosphate-sugar epimerase
MISKSSKIFVAAHKGLIGSAILRKLREKKYKISLKKQLTIAFNDYIKKDTF